MQLHVLCTNQSAFAQTKSHHRQATGQFRMQALAILTIYVDHCSLRHFPKRTSKETFLRLIVRLHRLVIVNMVLSQVEKHSHIEIQPVYTFLINPVRADFHHCFFTAVRDHLTQQSLHINGFRRRFKRRECTLTEIIANGSQQTDRIGAPKQMLGQHRDRGLAIGSGDPCNAQLLIGVIIKTTRDQRECFADVFHLHEINRKMRTEILL